MFTSRLKAARSASGMSQKAVAERLHLTQQAYACYETGKSSPKGDMILKISEVLGVSVNYLLGVSDFPVPAPSPSGSRWIPVYGRVAAGIPIEAIEDIIDEE